MSKKDLYLTLIIGFLTGLLSLPILTNFIGPIGLISPIGPIGTISLIVFGFTAAAPFTLWLVYFFSRFFPVLKQFGRFLATGTLNAAVDLGILNLLMLLTGVKTGAYFTLFKGVSFVVAVTNSYIWNKFWTFENREAVTPKEISKFVLFTAVGLVINDGTASILVNWVGAPEGLTPAIWANIAAVSSVGLTLFWNFISYRYFVFKKLVL